MNVKIEAGAHVQFTDKPIINVMGNVVQNNYVVQTPMNETPEQEAEVEEAEVVEEEAEVAEEVETSSLQQKIAMCFTTGLLNVNEPSRLYFLLLALWARRMLPSKEVPDFVRLVVGAYPAIVDDERTEQQIVYAVQNMNRKAPQFFDTFISDQSSMIAYIDLMYPKKKDGSRRKEGAAAVELAADLFLALKK